MLRSIRLRLTLSFAANALLAAFALGAVLLMILENYYTQRELDYLRGNAKVISMTLTKIIGADLPHDEIQSQIKSLAFLSQTRVRVLDTNGQTSYDSGVVDQVKLDLGVAKQELATQNKNTFRFIAVGDKITKTLSILDSPTAAPDMTIPKDSAVIVYRSISVSGSPFGFDMNAAYVNPNERSQELIKTSLVDPQGNLQGTVILSDGPALGRDILTSVATGWVIASIIAVVLAAGVGWFISRRISAPVLALTNATTQMANGDLSSRANISSRDEFGTLAHSFNEMADQVETTVNALRRFASDAAHELNSPLTALRTDLDLALAEEQPRAMIERAQVIVKRLEELNRNLLDLSRLEAARENQHAAPIDLVDVVRQLSEVYASQAEQAEITYQVELPDAPIIVHADAVQIQRAVANLIENALKFTPPKGIVRVKAWRDEDAASITVSDTGIGIPVDDLPQLFNRFHRGRNATSFAGSGLGLAIVKAIAEQNGAKVNAENLSPGARFTLRWKMAS